MPQAFTSRYQTPALLFWAELFLLLLLAAVEKRWPMSSLVFVEICLFAIFARGAYLARYPIRQARWHGFQVNAAGAALLSGVDDPTQFYYGAVDVRHIVDDARYLKEHGLSIFADRSSGLPGLQLTSVPSPAAGECTGAVQSVTQVSPGDFRITGWGWDIAEHKPVSHIVVVADKQVVGVGAVGDWRPTVRAANPYINTSFSGFTAYAKAVAPLSAVAIYDGGRSSKRRACYIAAAHLPAVP
jgi:hypothetical protein